MGILSDMSNALSGKKRKTSKESKARRNARKLRNASGKIASARIRYEQALKQWRGKGHPAAALAEATIAFADLCGLGAMSWDDPNVPQQVRDLAQRGAGS